MTPEPRIPVPVDEFWHIAHRLQRAELVAGRVIELVPPGIRHGVLVVGLSRRLDTYMTGNALGIVTSDAGFVLSTDPPTVRGPDIAVVLRERVPSPLPVRFFSGAPDLAVEVLSSDDRPGEIAARVADYLQAGTVAVWVVDPEQRMLIVHTRAGATTFHKGETLRGALPIPGFDVPLEELFARTD